jgi:hypothetical protein
VAWGHNNTQHHPGQRAAWNGAVGPATCSPTQQLWEHNPTSVTHQSPASQRPREGKTRGRARSWAQVADDRTCRTLARHWKTPGKAITTPTPVTHVHHLWDASPPPSHTTQRTHMPFTTTAALTTTSLCQSTHHVLIQGRDAELIPGGGLQTYDGRGGDVGGGHGLLPVTPHPLAAQRMNNRTRARDRGGGE